MKKVVSSLLIMTMLTTVLAGCGSGSKDEGKKPQADSGETETIAIQLVNVVPELPDVEAVEAELNKITKKEINCKVDYLRQQYPSESVHRRSSDDNKYEYRQR